MSIITFLSSLIICILLIPLVRSFSFRFGYVSVPRKDRWHREPTPTLGGIAIFIAFIGSLIISLTISSGWDQLFVYWSLLAGSTLIFITGLYDDFKRITPPVKLFIQIIAATIVIFFGDRIDFFRWPIANILLTYIWLVGITNAINLLDNMDGLAGGISFIAALVLSYFFWRAENIPLLIISLSLAGSILGFVIFNFPPAKIFMGDSGSMFLGFSLAALAIIRRPQASNVFAIIAVPTLLFLLPILDTTLVTITRLMRGQSPTQGGTDHTSHRLIAFGLNERQAVLALYLIAIMSGVAGAGIEAIDYDLSLVLIPILLLVLSLFVAYLGRLKVVSDVVPKQGNIARLMVDITYKRRLLELALDLLIIAISYYLAFWTRFGLDMTTDSMNLFMQSWPIALGAAYLSFFLFGVYRGVWRYISVNDLIRYVLAAVSAVILTALVLILLYEPGTYTYDVFLLYGLFLLLGLAASRSSFQILDRIYSSQRTRQGKDRIIIYGADDAGEMALRWIMRNPEIGYRPVGFIDDDQFKWGRSIHSIKVLGGKEKTEAVLEDNGINGVIVSSKDLLVTDNGKELISICSDRGIWLKTMRLEFELIE
jgi:UDP-GlcNAc:undecaprenyl-phosphate GlcNAc-1-phosphate transferase